jgi:hypothetical protein
VAHWHPAVLEKITHHPDFEERAHRRLHQLPPNLLTAYDVQDFFGDHQRTTLQHGNGVQMILARIEGLLVQMAIDHSKEKMQTLVIAWHDLRNAFGSIPHGHLLELFHSLQFPDGL